MMQIAEFYHKALIVNVTHSVREGRSVYDATRFAWSLNPLRAENAEIILARCGHEIIEAFVAFRWIDATRENFPDLWDQLDGMPVVGRYPKDRYGFEGREADDDIRNLYVGKRVPDKYIGQNPIRYIKC